MVDLAALHARVQRSVVSVRSNEIIRDGIVVKYGFAATHVMVDSRNGFCRLRGRITVSFPGGRELHPSILFSDDSFGLLVFNNIHLPELEALEFYDGNLEDCQEVFAYSSRSQFRTINRGTIMSFFSDGFHHNCSAHAVTRYGSPVVNGAAQLVGVCFDFAEYVRAYDINYIQARLTAMSP